VKAAENAERPTSNAQYRTTDCDGVSGNVFHWALSVGRFFVFAVPIAVREILSSV
jgi:hypothetical protein